MSWYAIGIDPGKTGALAIIRNDGFPGGIWDYPGDSASLWAMLRNSLLNDPNSFDVRLVVLEKVSAMPKQGVSSTFKFGTNFGIWQATVAALRWPMELISPQRWRQVLDSSVPAKPSKDDLLAFALRKWPMMEDSLFRKKDHNRAEALIMAEYARVKVLGQAK